MEEITKIDAIKSWLSNIWMRISRHFLKCQNPNKCYGTFDMFSVDSYDDESNYSMEVNVDGVADVMYLYYCPLCGRKLRANNTSR